MSPRDEKAVYEPQDPSTQEELSVLETTIATTPWVEYKEIPSRAFDTLLKDLSINSSKELVASLTTLAATHKESYEKTAKAFQAYLNTKAKHYYSASHEIRQELFFSTKKDAETTINQQSDILVEDGDIGSATLQLLDNIRVCDYMQARGVSVFAEQAKELFTQWYSCIYTAWTIETTSDIQRLITKKQRYDTAANVTAFQQFLNAEAQKYGKTALQVTGRLSSADIRLCQELRSAFVLKQLDSSRSDDVWRRKYMRLDTNTDPVDDEGIQWDLLDKRVTNVDMVKTFQALQKRIASGKFGKQSDAYITKVSGLCGDLMTAWWWLQAAETTGIWVASATKSYEAAKRALRAGIAEDPVMNDRVKGECMTYCVRSMRENFEKVGVDIGSDYPLCVGGDPAFRREVLGPINNGAPRDQRLRQDAKKQIAYFQDKPEYFRGFPLRSIPADKLDQYCDYLENFLYDSFHDAMRDYDSHGVICPLLHNRTQNWHASTCYLNDSEAIIVADSYYMPDGRHGPFLDYVKAVWKKMQWWTATEWVILLPSFAYKAVQE